MSAISTVPLPVGIAVNGLNLSAPVTPADAETLRALLNTHHLILFRGQALAGPEQVRTLETFGRVVDEGGDRSRFTLVSGAKDSLVKPGRLVFHTDNHFTRVPLDVLSLYGLSIDASASPTLFIDNMAAYKRLPQALAERLANLEAINISHYFHGLGHLRARDVEPVRADAPRAVHRIICRHPQSGEPYIYLTEGHTHHIVGLPLEESDALVEQVHKALYQPAFTYSHQWQPDDLIIWNNRVVQHARGPVPDVKVDPDAPPRTLRRVVVGPLGFHEQVALPASLAASAEGKRMREAAANRQ
jgi:alpha-ketoglutarate-dependent taurine dioxygenase